MQLRLHALGEMVENLNKPGMKSQRDEARMTTIPQGRPRGSRTKRHRDAPRGNNPRNPTDTQDDQYENIRDIPMDEENSQNPGNTGNRETRPKDLGSSRGNINCGNVLYPKALVGAEADEAGPAWKEGWQVFQASLASTWEGRGTKPSEDAQIQPKRQTQHKYYNSEHRNN
uniref:Uncharacterized protein n=1 Tax=Cannabis sativa TaxID=3483 RepID=A0A803Q6V1_CANSA